MEGFRRASHNCIGCNNWFHKFCLLACHIPIPKRESNFLCKSCEIPETLQWNHEKFVNAYTLDNFLTILLLHCKQYECFLQSSLGCSTVEGTLNLSLKATITLMIRREIYESKTMFLNMLLSTVNLAYNDHKYDCYGGENNRCLCIFTQIWKIAVKQRCMSIHCPVINKEVTKYLPAFLIYHVQKT